MGRLRRVAVLTATFVAVLGPRPSAAQGIDPTVFVDRTGTAAGEQMLITGSGWPAGASLIVELCGHGGLRGSVDCDVPHQRSAGVGPAGTFSVELTTALPPTPCPCVVKATDQATQIAATAPISVAGLPTVPITASDGPLARAVEISGVEITGGGTLAELFGAGGRRVLEITLVNTGPLPIDSPDVSVAWGTGLNPDGFVEPPETTRLEPGETQTLTVALHRPALTLGEQVAVVEVQGVGEPVTARATTTGYPWGLLAVALIAVQLLLVRLRNGFRRRMGRRHVPPAGDPWAKGEILALPAGEPGSDVADGDDAPATVVVDLAEAERAGAPAEIHNGAAPVPAPSAPLASPAMGTDPPVHPVDVPVHAAAGDRAQGGPAGPTDHRRNGHTPVVDVAKPADVVDLAVREAAAVRERAAVALAHAVELSEVLLADAAARVREIEGAVDEQLREAQRRHEAATEALCSAQARAAELVTAAERAAAAALADREAARALREQALVEMAALRGQVVESARAAVDRVLDDLETEARTLGTQKPSTVELGLSERVPELGPSGRAPRLGGLDQRVADAVSRALADTSVAHRTPHPPVR